MQIELSKDELRYLISACSEASQTQRNLLFQIESIGDKAIKKEVKDKLFEYIRIWTDLADTLKKYEEEA